MSDNLGESPTRAMAFDWLRFKGLSELEQMAMFMQLYRRSTVLVIDRANQIADSQSVAVVALERPAIGDGQARARRS